MIVTFNTKSTLISLLRNRQMTFPATSSFQFFLKADDRGVFWEDIWVEIMTCLLGSASVRHLKVRILFAKCKEDLHPSHSWVGFALSKRQEPVHWDPGGWHNRSDWCFTSLPKARWMGQELLPANSYCKTQRVHLCLSKISFGLSLSSRSRKVQARDHWLVLL